MPNAIIDGESEDIKISETVRVFDNKHNGVSCKMIINNIQQEQE